MRVFSSNSDSIQVWGPVASVDVKISAMGSVIDYSWLLVGISLGAKEIVDVRQCFNEMSYVYALGNNQNSCRMSLTFAIFIGRENCKGRENNTGSIDRGLEAYAMSRISKKITPTAVTIGDFSRMGWITGIDIGNLDARRGICYGTIHFLMELRKS